MVGGGVSVGPVGAGAGAVGAFISVVIGASAGSGVAMAGTRVFKREAAGAGAGGILPRPGKPKLSSTRETRDD